MTDLHGNEPIVFDYATAGLLVTAARSAATAITSEAGARRGAVTTAEQEFKGYYATLFSDNARTAASDGTQLVAALHGLATITQNLVAAAHAEDERRATARKWYHDQQNRSTLDKIGDALFGEDSPPEGPKPPPAPVLPTIPQPQPRHTGGQGSSGGTSSAVPEHLTSFATTSAAANSRIDPHQTRVASLVHTFNANTKWGTLEAQPLLAAFLAWNKANDNDVKWARTIAAAFTAAGGSGGLVTVSNSGLGAALKAAGVNATRTDLVISMPQTKGFSVTTGYSLDPVNTATGNFIESETDLATYGAAELTLTRMYNSFTVEEGAFGHGWSSLAEAGLSIDDEKASFTVADGRVVVFPRLGDGWGQPVSDALWLTAEDDGSHRITGNDGTWWRCTPEGRLAAYGTGPGTTVTLTHDDGGRLVGIAHERGRSLTLTWTGSRITSATTDNGRVASYTYDDAGHLLSVTAPGSEQPSRTYRWDTDAHLITAVIDADGVVEAENTYDEQRRVATQLTPHGRHVRFSYLPGRVTVIDDPDGSSSNTWIADPYGRLIGVIDSDDNRQSMSYDAHGNLVVVTERDGATTIHEYDDRSRRTRTVTPSGADLQFGYDELDRVTTVITEAGAVTTYTYEGDERQPATITDPEGGVTRLTWDRGLLTRIVGPSGITVSFVHDEHGNLVSSSDAEGNTARLEWDAAGRVSASITPLGHRTEFVYDTAGRLVRRVDPDGATWQYEHTAGGRLAAVIDPTGARSAAEYDASGEQSLLTDPIGRQLSFTHDVLGNLSSTTLPDGSRWQYSYDSLSRRTATISPEGSVWSTSFDANGAPVAVTDPTGMSKAFATTRDPNTLETTTADGTTTWAFDALGRPTRHSAIDGGEIVRVFDRCGRLVESVDAEGGLTRFTYAPSGHRTAVTSPSGATTRYEWDSCGRLAASIDPAGARTTYTYDADRRLTRVTLPTGETADTTYDVCGRVIARHVPGVGSSELTYDAAGRIIELRDPSSGRRRFTYDAAGQLIAATDGNGGTTRYEHDPIGRVVAITNPLGAVTRREFNSLDRCTSQTDALGRTMTAGYDAAGRQVWQHDADGRRLELTYDAAGQLAGVSVNGGLQSSFTRDLRSRRMTIVDHTDATRECVHELAWNGRHQLISRSRDGRAVSWTYDADGRRTSMTTPDGATTSYTYDARGMLASVEHPPLGRATFDRDAVGRLVAAAAGGLMQTWTYADGFPVEHTLTSLDATSRTTITRADDGRILSLDHDGQTTSFTYDDACQLVAAATGGHATTWRYDAAGRLVSETADGVVTDHTYDAVGQLLTTTRGAARTTYAYDDLGRRVSAVSQDTATTYSWDALGWLSKISQGSDVEHILHVDALGELASVDGIAVFHDTAAWAGGIAQIGQVPVVPAGPVTGVGSTWTGVGWRTARATLGADPWSLPQAAGPGLPPGVSVGAGGELSVAGLEWMNARVYDATSRGFLSTDPLDSTPGAGWAGNPYSYAGNDPLHALDPLGLKPATDADLEKWSNQHSGIGAYVVAGLVVAAGVALIATAPFDGPLGPALGGALISGGVSAIQARAEGKSFSDPETWAEIGISAAVGAVGGGAGAMADSAVESTVTNMIANQTIDAASKETVQIGLKLAANVVVDAGTGGLEGGATYTAEAIEGKHGFSVSGLAGSTGGGALAGAIGGFAGGSTAGLGSEVAHAAGRKVVATTLSTVEGGISGTYSSLIGGGLSEDGPSGADLAKGGATDGITAGAGGFHENFRAH